MKKLFLALALGLMILPESIAQENTLSYEKISNGLEWRCIGPFRGGRSAAVTGVEGKPMLFYMGSTGGGVWKTTNGGSTWENISDGYFAHH